MAPRAAEASWSLQVAHPRQLSDIASFVVMPLTKVRTVSVDNININIRQIPASLR